MFAAFITTTILYECSNLSFLKRRVKRKNVGHGSKTDLNFRSSKKSLGTFSGDDLSYRLSVRF
jgi:hypothetical protein